MNGKDFRRIKLWKKYFFYENQIKIKNLENRKTWVFSASILKGLPLKWWYFWKIMI